jgi:DNA-binding SARP family transcriptional activator
MVRPRVMAPLRQTEGESFDVLLLGPVCARGEAGEIEIRGARPLALLSLLALQAGERVSADELVEGIWGDEPPSQARHALHVWVSMLRAAVGFAAIETHRGSYRLNVDQGRVDALRFRSTVRSLGCDHSAETLEELRDALGQWRGPALGGVSDSARLRGVAAALEEERLDALERRLDIELDLGGGAEVIGELTELVAANALREHLRAQLMTALYRGGRQADALACYRDVRALLTGALGLEPGPELRELEQAILRQDPALAAGPIRVGRDDLVRAAYALLTLAAAIGGSGPPPS